MNRRQYLHTLAASLSGAWAFAQQAQTTFFTVQKRDGRWWFVTPDDRPFFSLALNHIDPSPLRYEINGDLWQRKYGNSMERWLKEAVRPDLDAWGFNSVGWTQEVVTRGLSNHRHSRAFTFEEYQWLGLPYCHQLGDRYEAGQPIADEVIAAARPFVDVLSFQHFSSSEKVVANLTHWHNQTGKPVLLADHAAVIKHADGSQAHDGAGYAAMLKTLRGLPGCVGYHLCGAYLRNETRKRALRDATEQPDTEALQILTEANRDAATWMRRTNQEQLPKH